MSSTVNGIGPFYVGVLLNVAIGGVNWMQLLDYFRLAPNDRLSIRLSVLAVFLISAIHTAFSCHIIWYYAIEHYGAPAHLLDATWSFGLDPLLTALVAAVVQAHYGWRVYIVGKRSTWVPALIGVLTLLQLALGIYITAVAFEDLAWAEIHRRLDAFVATWLFAMAVGDAVITGTLTYYLRQVRSDFSSTNSLIDRIVRGIVANNLLTAVTAVASGILFVASRDTGWHVVFGLTLIRLYTLSFMSSLNSRHSIRTDLGCSPPFPDQLASPPSAPARLPTLSTMRTTSSSATSHLFPLALARSALARGNSAQSVSSGRRGRAEKDKGARTALGGDSLPITVQIESEIIEETDAHGAIVRRSMLEGDSWDPARFYTNPSPSPAPSCPGSAEGPELPFEIPFVHSVRKLGDEVKGEDMV
ncbi:hypothetical protein JCM10450v2_003681 [Rhodotorula kratochvilovae]